MEGSTPAAGDQVNSPLVVEMRWKKRDVDGSHRAWTHRWATNGAGHHRLRGTSAGKISLQEDRSLDRAIPIGRGLHESERSIQGNRSGHLRQSIQHHPAITGT